MILDELLSYGAVAVGGGGAVAALRAFLEHRRHRAGAPEGARIVVEGAGAAVATLQAVLTTMRDELHERDQRIDKLEERLRVKDEEVRSLRARVAGLETELHTYKGAHP